MAIYTLRIYNNAVGYVRDIDDASLLPFYEETNANRRLKMLEPIAYQTWTRAITCMFNQDLQVFFLNHCIYRLMPDTRVITSFQEFLIRCSDTHTLSISFRSAQKPDAKTKED